MPHSVSRIRNYKVEPCNFLIPTSQIPLCYCFRMTKEEKLQKFTEQLASDENTLAVILFGSQARGDSTDESDIDLVVILKEGYERRVEFFDGQAFEIIYTTEEAAVDYWHANMADAVSLWRVAQVLFDRDGIGERLKRVGAEFCEQKSPEVSESTFKHLRFDAEDALRSAERFKDSDPAKASYILYHKVAGLMGLFFDLKGMWKPATKQRLEEIDALDPELGKLFRDFFLASDLDQRIVLVKEITARIFEGSGRVEL